MASVRLGRDKRGVAALEFAIVAPMVFAFVVGVIDITKAMILQEQVYEAAHTIPITASNLAVQPDHTTTLTVAQAQQSMSAIFAEIPWLRGGIESGARSVTLTSVTFTLANASCNPQTTTCAYLAQVAWSVSYADPSGRYPGNANTFTAVTRACSNLTQVAPTAITPGNLTQLPTANVVNPDPILVADVHYQYTPMFLTFITGPVDFWASGYWSVRAVSANAAAGQQYTTYDLANQNGGVGKCPGFD